MDLTDTNEELMKSALEDLSKADRGGKYYKKVPGAGPVNKKTGKRGAKYFYTKAAYEKHMAKQGGGAHVDGERAKTESKSKRGGRLAVQMYSQGATPTEVRQALIDKIGMSHAGASSLAMDARSRPGAQVAEGLRRMKEDVQRKPRPKGQSEAERTGQTAEDIKAAEERYDKMWAGGTSPSEKARARAKAKREARRKAMQGKATPDLVTETIEYHQQMLGKSEDEMDALDAAHEELMKSVGQSEAQSEYEAAVERLNKSAHACPLADRPMVQFGEDGLVTPRASERAKLVVSYADLGYRVQPDRPAQVSSETPLVALTEDAQGRAGY